MKFDANQVPRDSRVWCLSEIFFWQFRFMGRDEFRVLTAVVCSKLNVCYLFTLLEGNGHEKPRASARPAD